MTTDSDLIARASAGDELAVNGGFDTPKWTIAKEGQGLPWVYVKPNAGTIRSYAQAMAGQTGVKAGGLTAATFAWQDVDATGEKAGVYGCNTFDKQFYFKM